MHELMQMGGGAFSKFNLKSPTPPRNPRIYFIFIFLSESVF